MPAMHSFAGSLPVGGQQSALVRQRSFVLAHSGGVSLQVPFGVSSSVGAGIEQKPPQQSSPLSQLSPCGRHGLRVVNARTLPD